MHIATAERIAAGRERYVEDNGNGYLVSRIFGVPGSTRGSPQAFMLEPDAEVVIDPHFHLVDQFQLFLRGGGEVGRRSFQAPFLHFTDAYTTYGPITFSDSEAAPAFLTLRVDPDDRQRYMPGAREEKRQRSGRNLVLLNGPSQLDGVAERGRWSTVRAEPDGLGVFAIDVEAGGTADSPCPPGARGQYWVVLEGSMTAQEASLPSGSCAFVGPDDEPPRVSAGPEGLRLLVLQFPHLP
jgi:mannose-6-phosphate isomerase-like protein (cupin superfamily)